MSYKKIISYIDAQNELEANIIRLAINYDNSGADEILIYDYSKDDGSKEKLLRVAKAITKQIDIPLNIGLYVSRFEDIKKALYTGANKVLIKNSLIQENSVIKEAADRFGTDKIIIEVDNNETLTQELANEYREKGVCGLMLKHISVTESMKQLIQKIALPILIRDSLSKNDLYELITMNNVLGVATNYFENNEVNSLALVDSKDMMKAKIALKNKDVLMNTFESSMKFSEFKQNQDGLIPVVVQDYKTSEVLMLAYMNEESYNMTVSTGKMTYYSRSRNELWTKGLTSGHFQYVKSLSLDCDKDTILAKVKQIGAACHTGNKTCFYTDLVRKEYNETNPLAVFQDIYDTIIDRKNNPKEGSYTNYLFDKGIDKILKKCGEEATEIVIAAKNPDAEELKYEISDFLYHMMVLMAECDLDWNDVIKELAHRR
ncbi:phosphoribosyl-ATP pyrophosphatase /phosphoribosyl-AMP cyclohydrolase [Mobilisporobacter senegalensis]|uniref:Histidine biosynthesis bifunctional protein HisIE n=1 Tax=Mobilisporobacter senegalensis TaxID=1329262 RepID=A0A3N1XT45_9FIRM|nr:bifunctional phosphoribosyl-AMP cyclohydrolase/phosphoribosyl-ATP diphosphatase HisIE [Mobilisporobacter senegalensis]ROR29331.1 phosphoribosyl-ATP pyrophosphatase /phosphoribosyl-AMP cyclohydrolase [Mobilisporobacter senegalensis]